MLFWKRKKVREEIKEVGEQLRNAGCYNRQEIRRLLKAASIDELTADLILISSAAKKHGFEERLMGTLTHFLETGQHIPLATASPLADNNPDDPAFG